MLAGLLQTPHPLLSPFHSQIAIVGYTNTGKSSLLAALAGMGAEEAGAQDRLFATLDPTLRCAGMGMESVEKLQENKKGGMHNRLALRLRLGQSMCWPAGGRRVMLHLARRGSRAAQWGLLFRTLLCT
jgi:energy-coupling factor transporter ATP-binding protein EcfA2